MFKDVSVVKKANIYFDGQVTSRTVIFAEGEKKTLGIMMPGEYEFGTEARELMEILSGELEILLPGSAEWVVINGGEEFEVPASSKFKVNVKTITDYCCSYLS
ncbi:MAG: pyrimidine/purine nucleoside phosphorylase [Gammaproteobacteria bacterium]|nr:pyrimidine/purine nucleoside phosphorylase [Gammaproteobacteria bacterium]